MSLSSAHDFSFVQLTIPGMTVPGLVASSLAVPSFLYGTAWKEQETERLTRLALEAGFRGVDTANQRRHYFEAGVGAAVKRAIASGTIRTRTWPLRCASPSRARSSTYRSIPSIRTFFTDPRAAEVSPQATVRCGGRWRSLRPLDEPDSSESAT